MSNEDGVTPVDGVRDTATGGVKPRTCKGALGTWRVLVGGSEHSVGGCGHDRGPSPTGKLQISGVYMRHHLSLLIGRKAVGGSIPRSEPGLGKTDRPGSQGGL